jgi:methionyl-tRNA formyltransferase
MQLVVMGTGPFAVPMFQSLAHSGHQLAALVTRPQRSSGRRKPAPNPMRDAAVELGIDVLEPDDVNQPGFLQQLAQFQPELLVVCDYGQILSTEALQVAPLGGINLHGSLLPSYRGAAPVQWAIIQGESTTGISVIHMTPRLDAGPCLVQRETPIGTQEDAGELESRLALLGIDPVLDAITLLEKWDRQSPIGDFQVDAESTPAPRLSRQDGEIDWSLPALQIANRIRGLKPWPGSFTHWQRETGSLRLIIDQALVLPTSAGGQAGEILEIDEQGIHVATGAGVIVIEQLKPAGKRILASAAFLRGYPLAIGTQLGP